MIRILDSKGFEVHYKTSTFPGGEVYVNVDTVFSNQGPFTVEARLTNSHEVMLLLMVTDAIRRRWFNAEIHLLMPYVPYARQDRVCNQGESLSIRVFCDLINSQRYESVTIWDPHSDVTPGLLDRCVVIPQWKFLRYIPNITDPYLIAPDAGASKKVHEAAHQYGCDYVVGSKIRNVTNGEIIDTELPITKYKHGYRRALIIDDICDGGRTFIELTKKIKKISSNPVYLYVTHGIFSKGLQVLKDAGIEHIYCANPWPRSAKDIELAKTYLTHVERPN